MKGSPQTDKIKFQFTDCPGYLKYFRNLIRGIQGAHVAVFVLDVYGACLEECRDQVLDQLYACFSGGIQNLVMCLNRMDHREIQWDRVFYDQVAIGFKQIAFKVGYNDDNIKAIIPISGWEGDNLTKMSDRMIWYEGPTLLQALESIVVNFPKELNDKPFMMAIKECHKIGGVDTVVCGVVLQGTVRPEMEVQVEASGKKSIVRSIEAHLEPIQEATVGMSIGIALKRLSTREIFVGDVLMQSTDSGTTLAQKRALSITATIEIVRKPFMQGIKKGIALIADMHTNHYGVNLLQLLEKINKDTGELLQANPESVDAMFLSARLLCQKHIKFAEQLYYGQGTSIAWKIFIKRRYPNYWVGSHQ
ncbi:hypothetical protein FGO68_gene8651 [Halteria grandinella]|uniref:Uncharacterized protein n=1 Tax=Halteria grandinella TaxID=5974 RepID=A0A8J8NMM3_HALGN|nr:hypothetical protein FGO68_gene8651 [Halteria grandinella]